MIEMHVWSRSDTTALPLKTKLASGASTSSMWILYLLPSFLWSEYHCSGG